MKHIALIAYLTALLSLAGHAYAEAQRKGPTSKLFIAEAVGNSQIQSGDKVFSARQATAFDAQGTIVETKANSHNAFVYSNGTGMFVDQNTRVEVDRFVQEPFTPGRTATEVEPSISRSDVFVARGLVGICTNQLVSGSAMTYSTPHAAVNIRGQKVAIEATSRETIVYLLEGDVTVRSSNPQERGSVILRPGERAVIRNVGAGQPQSITVGPIDRKMMTSLDERVTVACNAKKAVTFEVIERKAKEGVDNPGGEDPALFAAGAPAPESTQPAGTPPPPLTLPTTTTSFAPNEAAGAGTTQEIVVRPTAPADLPANIVVSPASLIPPGR
jgi:hypothetical protein